MCMSAEVEMDTSPAEKVASNEVFTQKEHVHCVHRACLLVGLWS